MSKGYYKFELGMSGTDFATASWVVEDTPESDLRLLVGVIVQGLFADAEELSSRYLKVTGRNGTLQWASKKIYSKRPDVKTCIFPEPFQ